MSAAAERSAKVRLGWRVHMVVWLSLLVLSLSITLWFVPFSTLKQWAMPYAVDVLPAAMHGEMLASVEDGDNAVQVRDAGDVFSQPSGMISQAALDTDAEGQKALLLAVRSLELQLVTQSEQYQILEQKYIALQQQLANGNVKPLSANASYAGLPMDKLDAIHADVQQLREDGEALKEAIYFLYKSGALQGLEQGSRK